jgi:hypothetical protein
MFKSKMGNSQIELLRTQIKRDAKYEAVISTEGLEFGIFHESKILNLYRNNIYFASNIRLNSGEQIHIGIRSIASYLGSKAYKFFLAQINDCREKQDSFFKYVYDAEILKSKELSAKQGGRANLERRNIVDSELKNEKDPRRHPRKPHHKSVFFISENQRHEGLITNVSHKGVFIKSDRPFAAGHSLTLVIPSREKEDIRINGKIMWIGQEGFGVRLLTRVNR